MRNRVVCDTCDENITFWKNVYKDTIHVRVVTSPVSSQEYDFCSINCLLAFFKERKTRRGTGNPDEGICDRPN